MTPRATFLFEIYLCLIDFIGGLVHEFWGKIFSKTTTEEEITCQN